VAGLAFLLAIATAIVVRDIPIGAPATVAQRFAPLKDPRILMALLATLLITIGFNTVYIFSAEVTAIATGGAGTLLAVLLLVYGVAGTVGNLGAGHLTDRLGNRRTASVFIGSQALALLLISFTSSSYLAMAILFGIWGLVAFAAVPPIQHRLIAANPETSGLALSWYTTAMYIGISLAPPVGAAALAIGGPTLVPVFGAATSVLAVIVFQIGYARRRGNHAQLPVQNGLVHAE